MKKAGLTSEDMGRAGEEKRDWVAVQQRTFTRWVNQQLARRGGQVTDLLQDLPDGIHLIHLVEELSGALLKGYSGRPRMRFEKLQNCMLALQAIKNEGIYLLGIGPEDIVDPNLKLILGLIWTLILHYHLQGGAGLTSRGGNGGEITATGASGAGTKSGGVAKSGPARARGAAMKSELLEWVKSKCEPKGVQVTNFTSSWQDGLAIAALVESLRPSTLDLEALKQQVKGGDVDARLTTTQLAIAKADEALGIPQIVEADDLVLTTTPDELSVLTYVGYFRAWSDSDPYRCMVMGRGIEAPTLGEPNQFQVSIYGTVNKEPLVLKDDQMKDLEIGVTGDDGKSLPVKVANNHDGTYTVEYTPTTPGDYEVGVKLYKKLVKGHGRIKLRGNAAASLSAAHCVAAGKGLTSAAALQSANFNITSYDAKGKRVLEGGNTFTVEFAGDFPADKTPFAHVQDNGDGTYSVSYKPFAEGDHQIAVKLNGEHIKSSPFTAKVERGPSPAHCAITEWNEVPGATGPKAGEAVLLDKRVSFVIEARDGAGKRFDSGGHKFDVDIKQVNAQGQVEEEGFQVDNADDDDDDAEVRNIVFSNQRDNGDGTYLVNFLVKGKVEANYKLFVTLDREPIHGTPLEFAVKRAALAPEKCTVEGSGLTKGFTHRPSHFTLTGRAADGQAMPIPKSDGYLVQVLGPDQKELPVHVEDNEDGTYDVSYTPTEVGPHRVSIHVKSQSLSGSPFTAQVEKFVDAAKCVAEGEGLSGEVTTNKPLVFTVKLFAPNGEPVHEGGDKVDVKITSTSSGNELNNISSVRDNKDGTYTVRYFLPFTDTFRLDVSLYGESIQSSPFRVTAVKGKEDFASFSWVAKDSTGKGMVKSVDDFAINIEGPSGKDIEGWRGVDIDEGAYGVDFVPTEGPGKYKINVRRNGKHIPNSPFILDLGEKKLPSTKLAFTARRKDGSPINDATPADFSAEVRGPDDVALETQIVDDGAPTFGLIFQPNVAGVHKVAIKYKGEEILNSQANVGGAPGAAAPPATPPPEKFLVRFPFTPLKKDGSPVNAKSPSEFVAKVSGPDDDVVSNEVQDLGGGKYAVAFEPKLPGIHTISIQHQGEEIKDGPFRINVGGQAMGGAAQPPAPAAEQPRKQFMRFPFTPKNAQDDSPIVPKSLSELTTEIAAPDGSSVPGEVTDMGNGQYGIVFEPKGPGRYAIGVKHNGQHVKDSPFHINVGGQPAAAAAPAAAAPAQQQSVKFPFACKLQDGTPFTPNSLSEFESEVVGPDDKTISSQVDDRGGQHGVVFVPGPPGRHRITVKWNGQPVQGSTFGINIGGGGTKPAEAPKPQAAASAPAPAATGGPQEIQTAGQKKFTFVSGKSFARFPLAPVSVTGQPLDDSVPQMEVTVHDPAQAEIGYKVIRDDDGFAILFQPLVPGDYTVIVRLADRHIRDSPFPVPIGTDRQRELMDKMGGAPLPQAKFSVTPKSTADDGRTNLLADVAGATAADFAVTIEGPEGQVVEGRLAAGAASASTLDVVFRPPVPGVYTIRIEHKTQGPIVNSPFRLQVAPPPGMSAQ